MLILKRKTNESVMIGDNIKIKVIRISNGFVQFGIAAPREIPVHREEVYFANRKRAEAKK